MTHDPLCYMHEGKWDGGCQCTLIVKVRADEREKIRAEFQPWWENHLKGVRQLIGWEDGD